MTSRQQNANAVIFVGAGVLGGSSWLNRQIDENFEKVEFRTDYPWGEVIQRIARRAALKGIQVVVEVPPEAQVHQTKQYKTLSEDENWTSIKIDGCTHGQLLIVPGPSGIHTVGYCKVEWEYFAANVKIRPKLSDKCNAQHTHVCTQTMLDHADQGCRTSQVSRRLLNAVAIPGAQRWKASFHARQHSQGADRPCRSEFGRHGRRLCRAQRGERMRSNPMQGTNEYPFTGGRARQEAEECLQKRPAHTCAIRGIALAIR
eukprot:s461_g5.t1